MLAWFVVLIGVVAALAIATGATRLPNNTLKGIAGAVALLVLFVFVAFSSVRHIGHDEIGLVNKNWGKDLPPGRIVAVNGEKGPQARILGPGWHLWLWPGLFDIDIEPVVEIGPDEVGLITAADGLPLPMGEAFATEWEDPQRMLDAEYFLGAGQGIKGPQASVLTPGKHRIHTKLFVVKPASVTNIDKGMVGVVKSNVGVAQETERGDLRLVEKGERGIWRLVLSPQRIYLNTQAYEVTPVSTKQVTVHYTSIDGGRLGSDREIVVRTSDGFTFPVDVRVQYQIAPEDAPMVVSEFGDDGDLLRERLTSTVRAIFRNNAEGVKALDYVNRRAEQEEASSTLLRDEMAKAGVTVIAVRIGEIGDEASLGALLQTQTDREIAVEEQKTFVVQQLAAEQKKELTRTEQEAEEERRLATASYDVQIAEQAKLQVIIEAEAEAEAIKVKAEAQAEAYKVIASQIGPGNAALVEVLKIIGAEGINITPRVMVVGQGGEGGGATGQTAETTALIGTMLDTMLDKHPPAVPDDG